MRNSNTIPMISQPRVLRQVKMLLFVFMVCLVLSGLTAFPIEWQLNLAHELIVRSALLGCCCYGYVEGRLHCWRNTNPANVGLFLADNSV